MLFKVLSDQVCRRFVRSFYCFVVSRVGSTFGLAASVPRGEQRITYFCWPSYYGYHRAFVFKHNIQAFPRCHRYPSKIASESTYDSRGRSVGVAIASKTLCDNFRGVRGIIASSPRTRKLIVRHRRKDRSS